MFNCILFGARLKLGCVQYRNVCKLDNLILDLQPEGYDVLLMIVHLIICMAGYRE